MSVEQIGTGFIYLAVVLGLLVLGKWLYDALHRRFVLRTELVEKDNLAVALAVSGYYLGLVIVLGGVVSGPASFSVVDDVIGLVIFGVLGTVLLNLSAWVNDAVVFSKFDNEREIVEDRNAGMGAVEAGNYVAVGLITAGAMSGEGGLVPGLVYWFAGLVALIVAGLLYDKMTSYDLHDEIEKDNAAVGVAFAGVLIGFGNIIRLAGEGDFVSWNQSLTEFGYYTVVGLCPVTAGAAVRRQGAASGRQSERRTRKRPTQPWRRRPRGRVVCRGVDAHRTHAVGATPVSGCGERMTTPPSARQTAPHGLVLKACIFITGLAGIVAEYVMATLASYLLGDAVLQWTLTVSLMLFAMGVGSRVSRFVRGAMLDAFVAVELLLSVVCAISATLAYFLSGWTTNLAPVIYGLSFTIGLLIGIEIPLATRLNQEFDELRGEHQLRA